MNGIEKIMERITADTQAEIDRIQLNAKAEVEKITAKYRAQADRETAEMQMKNEKAAAEREERLVSVAQMEARKEILAAKQRHVDAAFDKAMEELCALPDEQYIAVVVDLLVQAAPDGVGEVVFSSTDRARVGAPAVEAANRKMNGKLTLSDQTRALKGGFVLVNGNVEINCTFDTLVRLQRGEMAGEVAKILFPQA